MQDFADFDRESTRIYKEVDKFSNLQWAQRDWEELINAQPGKKRTRSQTDPCATESKEWFKNTDAQFGYGEITKGAMSQIIDLFQNISTHEGFKDLDLATNLDPTVYDMKSSAQSTFLDIGAGFGKPVFHAAMQTGCYSYGIEIVPARVAFCADQKCQFMDYYEQERKRNSDKNNEKANYSEIIIQHKQQSSQSTKKQETEAKNQNQIAIKQLKEMRKQSEILISSMEDYNQLVENSMEQLPMQMIVRRHISGLSALEQDLQLKIEKRLKHTSTCKKALSVQKDSCVSSPERNSPFTPRQHTVNYIAFDWISLCDFQLVDAAKDYDRYTDNNGEDISHIYSYNKVMSAIDLEGIAKTLNKTNFKVLAWYQDPRITEKAGVKNVKLLQRMPMHSTGNEKFSCYIYLKDPLVCLPKANKTQKIQNSIAQKKRAKK